MSLPSISFFKYYFLGKLLEGCFAHLLSSCIAWSHSFSPSCSSEHRASPKKRLVTSEQRDMMSPRYSVFLFYQVLATLSRDSNNTNEPQQFRSIEPENDDSWIDLLQPPRSNIKNKESTQEQHKNNTHKGVSNNPKFTDMLQPSGT